VTGAPASEHRDRLPDRLRAPAAYRHWTPVEIRFRDIDLLGHVNNVALTGWLEDGRARLELPIQPVAPAPGKPAIVLAELRVQFLEEVHFEDAVRVGTVIERLGRTSVTIGQAVFAGDRCAVIGRVIEVLIDDRTRAPMAWPADFAALFERYRLS
jgi:acyl-CoA thioester hydrolase